MQKRASLSSFFEDSKRLLLIHNNIDKIDWLENNLGNLNHTALLFIKFTVLKKSYPNKKQFKEVPIFHLNKTNSIPKTLWNEIGKNLDHDF